VDTEFNWLRVRYRVFHLNATLTTAHEPLNAQNYETNGNVGFLQPHPVVAADALL
jgi:hypothetical protein